MSCTGPGAATPKAAVAQPGAPHQTRWQWMWRCQRILGVVAQSTLWLGFMGSWLWVRKKNPWTSGIYWRAWCLLKKFLLFKAAYLASAILAKDWEMRETQRPRGPVGPIGPRWYQSLPPPVSPHLLSRVFYFFLVKIPSKINENQQRSAKPLASWIDFLKLWPLEFVPNLPSVLAAAWPKGHNVTMCVMFFSSNPKLGGNLQQRINFSLMKPCWHVWWCMAIHGHTVPYFTQIYMPWHTSIWCTVIWLSWIIMRFLVYSKKTFAHVRFLFHTM